MSAATAVAEKMKPDLARALILVADFENEKASESEGKMKASERSAPA